MYQLNVDEDNAGVRLRMDPHFFLADFNAGVAWTQLRAAAAAVKVLLVHTENSRDWTYERAMEVAARSARAAPPACRPPSATAARRSTSSRV